ncbi:ubiquinone biosynthesis protein UbiB [Paramagnetospirillum marisnigri]|uniref:3-demethoxyubiquinol 3-hydroxylase n=1 Tax=Paramagnetospirillum marisnigri TaxID=1285242 RepID=A0A178MMA4_9PROT|nr:demethoxyubiquinone hydroxylase family protein [Paramagnetospirillum marisnigri]OAN49799.1 ubiquinone biosynthesis protein UbiB [Paramagnetospirillum marisnigri]
MRKPIPGDLTRQQMIERILRVDQAGGLGAVRIYQGQMAVLGKGAAAPVIRHMAEQEKEHLATFDRLIGQRGVRPTILSPIWHVAGFALGAATALLGEKAAMACTVAVEETIDAHYAAQAEALGEDEPELKQTILKFRDEEIEHRDIGLERGAEQTPAYPVLSTAIRTGCRLAIWLSERV